MILVLSRMRNNLHRGIPASAYSADDVKSVRLAINDRGEVLMFLMYLARVEFLRAILPVFSPLHAIFLYPNRQVLSPMATTRARMRDLDIS